MEITQPGTGTVGMSFRNAGGATGNYGREWNTHSELPTYADLSGEEWGTIAANSNKKNAGKRNRNLVPAELSISIDSGALDLMQRYNFNTSCIFMDQEIGMIDKKFTYNFE